MTPSIVALIPARKGSKRCPGKNARMLGGEPLWTYSYDAAVISRIFSKILVVTDDPAIRPEGSRFERSAYSATDEAPDIVWVREVLNAFPDFDAFAILRPTSPFRTAEAIQRAWQEFQKLQPCDSLRAVEPVKQHPLKMWLISNSTPEMKPLLSNWTLSDGPPLYARDFHSQPTQTLPACYVQNASLEIAWTKTVTNRCSISGDRVMPFFTQGLEGFDINTEEDFARAEQIVAERAHAASQA